MLSADKAENVRRAGIYVGPVVLASVVGNAVYGVMFGTTTINLGGQPFFMNVVFAVIGGIIAWGITDKLGRIAWMVFVLHHAIQALATIWGSRIGSGWNLMMPRFNSGPKTRSTYYQRFGTKRFAGTPQQSSL